MTRIWIMAAVMTAALIGEQAEAKDYVRILDVEEVSVYLDMDSVKPVTPDIRSATIVVVEPVHAFESGKVNELYMYVDCARRLGAIKGVMEYDVAGQVLLNYEVPDSELDYVADNAPHTLFLFDVVCEVKRPQPDQIVTADDRLALRDKVQAF